MNEKRIAVVAIVIDEQSAAVEVNNVLHERNDIIIGRMGLPYRERGISLISVAVDGGEPQIFSIKEPYRSERWKENVMRGQAVVEIPVELSSGPHTLTLGAVDDHIVFDQWMVDFRPGRRFYLFPVQPSSSRIKLKT